MTTHRTVGSAGEIDTARELLDELRAQIDVLTDQVRSGRIVDLSDSILT